MAFTATLGGSISLSMTVGDTSLSDAAHNLITSKGARTGVPVARAVDHNDVRSLSGHFIITGSSKDDAISKVAAINAMLRTGTTLALQSNSATYSVTFNVLPSPRSAPPLGDPMWENKNQCLLPFSLLCEPYAYGPETTLVNGSTYTLPSNIDVTVPGDYLTPLQVQMNGNLHCAYLGLFPDQTTALPLWDGESTASKKVTWTGGASADATHWSAYGGAYRQISAGPCYGTFTDTTMPAGTYLMLVRNGSETAGNAGLWLAGTVVSTATTGFRLWAGGTWRMPTAAVRGAVASTFNGVYGWISTANMGVDYVGALPTSWGWAYCQNPTDANNYSWVTVEYDGRVYGDDSAVTATAASGGLSAVGTQRLVVFADSAHGTATSGTVSTAVTIKAIPRYALWR